MRIYLKNNIAKFHHDPVWNDGALGFFEEHHPNSNKNKLRSDTGSVPDSTMYQSAGRIYFINDKMHISNF